MLSEENKPDFKKTDSHPLTDDEDVIEEAAFEDKLVNNSKKTLHAQKYPWSDLLSAALKALAIFFLLLAISIPVYQDQSFFSALASSDAGFRSYGLWMVITVFVAILLLGVSLAQLFLQKQRRFTVYFSGFGLVTSVLCTLLVVAFGGSYGDISAGPIVLLSFVLIFVFADVILLSFLPSKSEKENEPALKEKEFHVLRIAEIVLALLGFAALLSTFFLRFYYYKNDGETKTAYRMIDALNQQCDLIVVLLSFTAFFALTLTNLTLLVQNARNLFHAPRRFLKRNRACLYFDLIGTGAFALLAFILTRFVTPSLVDDGNVAILDTIPFFLVGISLIVESALSAHYIDPVIEDDTKEKKKNSRPYTGHLTSLLFLFVMSILAFAAFFGRIVTIQGTYNGAQFYPTNGSDGAVIGWELLKEYVFPSTRGTAQDGSLISGSGFSLLALVIFLFSISDILFLLFALISFFARSKTFARLSMVGVIALYIEIFAVWVFGLDYAIASEVNKETIAAYLMSNRFETLSALGISQSQLASEATAYHISTTSGTMVYFILSTAIGVLCIIFHPFTKQTNQEELAVNIASADAFKDQNLFAPAKEEKPETQEEKKDETEWACPKCGVVNHGKYCENCGAAGPFAPKAEAPKKVSFDPCPAFALIDDDEAERKEELVKRQAEAFPNPTLPAVTRFVVDYARDSRLHLSYTPEIIASFLAGLGATKLTILQGMSGTGKTSLPKIFAEALDCDCRLVEVESSWKDKNELIGYYNEFTKLFTPKKFTTALYAATLEKETINFIVLDEMNLSRIEYYFSDFLSLMEAEPDKRIFSLSSVPLFRQEEGERKDYLGLSKGTSIRVTPNLWFIGTANRDESTFEISDKVYDRSNIINLNHRAPKAVPQSEPRKPQYLSYVALQNLFDQALSSFHFDLDSVPYLSKVEDILSPYNISFGNRIARQIEAYVRIYCSCFLDGDAHREEALESILLDKVVHKLEYKSIEDKESLAEAFEAIGLKRCATFIRSLSEDL